MVNFTMDDKDALMTIRNFYETKLDYTVEIVELQAFNYVMQLLEDRIRTIEKITPILKKMDSGELDAETQAEELLDLYMESLIYDQ